MALSSIFESVNIRGEENAEAFIDAYEASLAEAERNPDRDRRMTLTDRDTLRSIMKKDSNNGR